MPPGPPKHKDLPLYLIFTDLDGTLLDHDTYSFEPARPALERLRQTRTPWVLVSSKTRTELEEIRRRLGHQGPFVSENGGAIFLPRGLDLPAPEGAIPQGHYRVIVLGSPAKEIAQAFDALASHYPIRALSRMSDEEVMRLTGLGLEEARAARQREFGEAFVADDPSLSEKSLAEAAAPWGLRVSRGGRFWHLMGRSDKGRAVRTLEAIYRRRHPHVVTVALGDAPNDAPMLAAANLAFLVARPDGGHHKVSVPGLNKVPLPGPSGFNQAILSLLGSH